MTRTTTTAPAVIPAMSPMLLGAGVTGPPVADSASEGCVDAAVVVGSELLESRWVEIEEIEEIEEIGDSEAEDEDEGETSVGFTIDVGLGAVSFDLEATVVGFGGVCAMALCGWIACGGGERGGARLSKATQALSRDIWAFSGIRERETIYNQGWSGYREDNVVKRMDVGEWKEGGEGPEEEGMGNEWSGRK